MPLLFYGAIAFLILLIAVVLMMIRTVDQEDESLRPPAPRPAGDDRARPVATGHEAWSASFATPGAESLAPPSPFPAPLPLPAPLSAPLPAAAHRVSLDGPAVPAILPTGPLAGRVSFDEQDALAERNDTLWDLVVQLRDHVEHLRGERAAQAEEIKRLRVALADAAHELKVLRANALSPAEATQSRRIKPPTGPQVH